MFKSIFGRKEDEEPGSERRMSLSQSLIQSFSGMKVKQNIEVENLVPAEQSSYKKQQYCTVCFRSFTMTFRQHHCRACANACCSQCSGGRVNDQRVCDVCYLKYSRPGDEIKKQKVLETLETLCAYLLYKRGLKSQELQKLKSQQAPTGQAAEQKEKLAQQQQIQQLEAEAVALAERKKELQEALAHVVEHNKKLQEKIHQLDRD